MKKSFFITLLFSPILLIADDLIVDKNSINQYEQNNYAHFNSFNFYGEYQGNHANIPPKPSYISDRINLPETIPILGNQFTIEAMVYSKAHPLLLHRTIIGNDINPATNDQNRPPTITFHSDHQINYGFGTGNEGFRIRVNNVRVDNEWIHVAFSFDGTTCKLFVNGELANSTDQAAGLIPNPVPISIIGNRFLGKIDEVRIWNLARSQTAIQSTMNGALSGDETGLVAYYPMDVNENWMLIDHSVNDNHASIVDAEILQRYSSQNCESPNGSSLCPFPKIRDALEVAEGGDNILVKEGRYSEVLFDELINYSYETEAPRITITGETENVKLDGTIELNANWEYSNGRYTAQVDLNDISKRAGIKVEEIYALWVNDRYMIPAMPINFSNPTDPTTSVQNNPESGTVFALNLTTPYYQRGESTLDLQDEYIVGDIDNLDASEEWSFDKENKILYLIAGNNIPNSTNVRVRIRTQILSLEFSDNLEFKNIDFFAGTFLFHMSSFILFEDLKFSHSWEAGISYISAGNVGYTRGNRFWGGTNNTVRNCIFEYINDARSIHWSGSMYPLGENILFQYNDWFKNTVWSPSASDNFDGGKKWWAASSSVGGSTFRHITMKQNHTGGLQPGLKSLVEYARIQDQYINIDGSGIQRTVGNTIGSTTRYSWLLNANRNGMRWDSKCAGTDGVVHNVLSAGNKRAFRLKGDRHRAFHLLAYDSNTTDISMPRFKFCGDNWGSNDGVNSDTKLGNINSRLLNSIAEKNLGANTPDAGDPAVTNGNGVLIAENISNEFLLNQSGIWFGRALDPDHTQPGNYPHLELQDPWFENRTRSVESLVSQFGLNPYTDANQNYDFRPRKGSVLIDAGVVIPGINDGQNDDSSYPLNHPPSYSGQQRAFVGDAPDIGPYEYGDSVYWIPGFRYSYPSVPIPSDGAVGVSMEYGLAFNYPWKTDYTGTAATVTVSGPGINRTESFQYPNNVLFETFLPGETYNWFVIVDSDSSDIWTFTISDKEYPLNDRSIDTTIVDSMLIPYQTKNLQVSNNKLAFLKFDVPSSINNSYNIHLNLVPEEVETLEGGIVVYKYNYTGWGEKLDVNNIGLIDKSLLTPIDTILSLIADSLLSLDLSAFIDSSGEHSFALGVLDLADNVSFYSKEKLITDGIDIIVLAGDLLGPSGNGSGYAPQTSVWPSLSFSKDSLSIAYDIPLEKEWNLISVPFTGVKTQPKQIFSTLIRKGLLEYVSSPSGYFKPGDPYSTLTSISSKEGYYLKLNGPANKIFFRGRALTDKTISLSAGWNMIAYSPDYELAVDKAFESLIASNTLQYVTGFVQGALVYDPDAPQSSTLNTLKPTKGYWVKVTDAVTNFSFPAQTQGSAVGKIAATHSVKHPEVNPNPSFMFVKGKIMGRYNVGDWVKVLSEDNHVVGAAEIIEGGYLRNSAVYGDDVTTEDIDGLKSGEKIAFAYDGDTLTSHVQFNPMSFHDVKLDYDTFLPTTFALYQNHPNPFNPITTIRYDLPEDGPVSIIIYDLMGREIKTLVKQVSAPGRYSVNWNGRNQFGKQIASGMYFYRMETPEFQSVKKLIFLK